MTRNSIIFLSVCLLVFLALRRGELQASLAHPGTAVLWASVGAVLGTGATAVAAKLVRFAERKAISSRVRRFVTWILVAGIALASPYLLVGIAGTMVIVGSFFGLLCVSLYSEILR